MAAYYQLAAIIFSGAVAYAPLMEHKDEKRLHFHPKSITDSQIAPPINLDSITTHF